jgi:hypothetical protein
LYEAANDFLGSSAPAGVGAAEAGGAAVGVKNIKRTTAHPAPDSTATPPTATLAMRVMDRPPGDSGVLILGTQLLFADVYPSMHTHSDIDKAHGFVEFSGQS